MTVTICSHLPKPENLLETRSQSILELPFPDQSHQHLDQVAVEELKGGDELY